jgi:hypothetical protein
MTRIKMVVSRNGWLILMLICLIASIEVFAQEIEATPQHTIPIVTPHANTEPNHQGAPTPVHAPVPVTHPAPVAPSPCVACLAGNFSGMCTSVPPFKPLFLIPLNPFYLFLIALCPLYPPIESHKLTSFHFANL